MMKIWHAVSVYSSRNQHERERNLRAQATWQAAYQAHASVFVPAHSSTYTRTARDIGDSRDVPFIKDVVQAAVNEASAGDYIILTNADTSFCVEAVRIIAAKLYHEPCLYSHRRETDRPYKLPLTVEDAQGRGTKSAGIDLFAFKLEWWQQLDFPDLLLGYEGWDWVLRFTMGLKARLPKEVIYHEYHQEPYWSQNRKIAIGNLHNRKLCLEWLKSRPDQAEILRHWPNIKTYEKDARGEI